MISNLAKVTTYLFLRGDIAKRKHLRDKAFRNLRKV